MNKNNQTGFLHIGLDMILPKDSVIGVFDIDSVTVQKHSRDFLTAAQKEHEIEDITTDLPISFILADHPEKKQRIIFSSFSLPTVTARMKRKFP